MFADNIPESRGETKNHHDRLSKKNISEGVSKNLPDKVTKTSSVTSPLPQSQSVTPTASVESASSKPTKKIEEAKVIS